MWRSIYEIDHQIGKNEIEYFKGYRGYSLIRKQVFVCRDVIFHETDFHYSRTNDKMDNNCGDPLYTIQVGEHELLVKASLGHVHQ